VHRFHRAAWCTPSPWCVRPPTERPEPSQGGIEGRAPLESPPTSAGMTPQGGVTAAHQQPLAPDRLGQGRFRARQDSGALRCRRPAGQGAVSRQQDDQGEGSAGRPEGRPIPAQQARAAGAPSLRTRWGIVVITTSSGPHPFANSMRPWHHRAVITPEAPRTWKRASVAAAAWQGDPGCRLASAPPGLDPPCRTRPPLSAARLHASLRPRPSVTSPDRRSRQQPLRQLQRNALKPRAWLADRLALGAVEADGSGAGLGRRAWWPAALAGWACIATRVCAITDPAIGLIANSMGCGTGGGKGGQRCGRLRLMRPVQPAAGGPRPDHRTDLRTPPMPPSAGACLLQRDPLEALDGLRRWPAALQLNAGVDRLVDPRPLEPPAGGPEPKNALLLSLARPSARGPCRPRARRIQGAGRGAGPARQRLIAGIGSNLAGPVALGERERPGLLLAPRAVCPAMPASCWPTGPCGESSRESSAVLGAGMASVTPRATAEACPPTGGGAAPALLPGTADTLTWLQNNRSSTAVPAWSDAPHRALIEAVKRAFESEEQLAAAGLPRLLQSSLRRKRHCKPLHAGRGQPPATRSPLTKAPSGAVQGPQARRNRTGGGRSQITGQCEGGVAVKLKGEGRAADPAAARLPAGAAAGRANRQPLQLGSVASSAIRRWLKQCFSGNPSSRRAFHGSHLHQPASLWPSPGPANPHDISCARRAREV